MRIEIVNGPNLNLLGRREPGIYGTEDMQSCLERLRGSFPGIEIGYYQSNHEGELIDRLQRTDADGVVLNAGAYTHTSLALADCIAAIDVPVIEVHVSNVASREPIRRTSLIAPVCRGTITGLGMDVYALGIIAFKLKVENGLTIFNF